MTDGIFAGLRVIDCASWIAGPAAATILSDFGAEVIKIEPPGAGDPWRASPAVPGKVTDYWWQLTSRNKRSLAIDLKHPEGLAVLHRLIGSTDVFITNFPLPVRERLKIAAADLLAINPRLVYGSISAYGEVGRGGGADRLRRHRLLGAHRPDGHGAGHARDRAGPLDAGHGRPSHRDGALCRHRDGALSPREDRARRRRPDLAAAERPVGQRLLRAEPAVRRARRAPAAAQSRRRARSPIIIAAATAAGS